MSSIADNINILTKYSRVGLKGGTQVSEGFILYMMEKTGLSRKEVEDQLKVTEFTVEAYVAMDYYGDGVDAQVPVVLLSNDEMKSLKKSLRKLIEGVYNDTEIRKVFQDNVIYVCKSIIGQNTSTATIEELTLDQIWNIVLGAPFGNKDMAKLKLNDLINMKKKDFRNFYKEFELTANEFCNNDYIHSDKLKNRRFMVDGSYLYWVPLIDLPGCKINIKTMKKITIGKDKSNQIVISGDDTTSRFHATLTQDSNNNIFVNDLNSTNGTYVNGIRVYKQHSLEYLDILTVGNSKVNWASYFNALNNDHSKHYTQYGSDEANIKKEKLYRSDSVGFILCFYKNFYNAYYNY